MAILSIPFNGVTYTLDTNRFVSGGVAHADPGAFLTALANTAAPAFVPVTVANGGTVNLVSTYNVLRTTADGTIAGAVLNTPVNPTDGEQIMVSSTGAITTVTGTISGANVIPAVTSFTAGQAYNLSYNTVAGKWFRVS